MAKYFLATILFLFGLVLLIPASVLAVNVAVTSEIDIYISDPGTTLKLSPVDSIDQIQVTATAVIITMPASGTEDVTITSPARYQFTVTGITNPGTVCGSGSSTLTIPAQTNQTAVTLDPSTICASGGGGAGAAPAPVVVTPTKPTTTTGEVTVTVSEGGTTTVTSEEETTASADLPANAVTANTTVTITPTATTETVLATAIAAVPATKSMIGGYIYNYSAISGGAAVSSFSKAVTISIGYTDAQIAGLDITSLKIYYWNETTNQWVALTSTVNVTDKTVNASVNHFTYFVIIGSPEGVGEEEEEEEEEEEVVEKPIEEMTIEEIKLKIAEILAIITQLRVQLAELIGVVEGCTITSFDRNLQVGITGDDVKCLQIILNSSTDTQLATSGLGSPGQETFYFGSLTKAAVIKFQEKYAEDILASWGLTAGTGFVGSTSRDKLNELLGG